MLQGLVDALLPTLVQEAETLLGSKPQSNDWITGLVQEIASLLGNKLPGWLQPEMDEIEALIEAGLEKLVSKV
jgi:hypothetical protein